MAKLNLFNQYDSVEETKKKDEPKKEESRGKEHPRIFIYGETQGRFEETILYYEEILKKKVEVLYHYLLPHGEKILNSYDAKKYIQRQSLQGTLENFDLPMFAAVSGIPLMGFAPPEENPNPTAIIGAAVGTLLFTPLRSVALILPNYCLEEGRAFLEEALPYAVIKESKYVDMPEVYA